MTNDKYIMCKLGEIRPNAFMVHLNIKLDIHGLELRGAAKIDTGCESTSISIQSAYLGIDKQSAMLYKAEAIKKGLKGSLGFGANDSQRDKVTQRDMFKEKKYMQCRALKFACPVSNFRLNGYKLGIENAGVSYDRTSNVLIGMDILKNFEYHCGSSLVTIEEEGINKGDHIFIGCLKDKINKAYINAVYTYLGYIPVSNCNTISNK